MPATRNLRFDTTSGEEIMSLNYFAVVLAAVASFIFGALWYGVLSRPWISARGLSAEDLSKAKAAMGTIPLPYIVAFVAELIMAWMLAGVLLHLEHGGLALTIRNTLISAAFLWFGFVATTLTVNHAFQGAKPSLTLIDGGHWLGVLLVQGAVLGAWGIH
jgi:hypothetical protein